MASGKLFFIKVISRFLTRKQRTSKQNLKTGCDNYAEKYRDLFQNTYRGIILYLISFGVIALGFVGSCLENSGIISGDSQPTG